MYLCEDSVTTDVTSAAPTIDGKVVASKSDENTVGLSETRYCEVIVTTMGLSGTSASTTSCGV